MKKKLLLIEDSAESLGATIYGKKVGSIADSSIFSFCGNKVLTTGEGGALVTNSKDIYEKVKLIRSHGRVDSQNYFNNPSHANYTQLGYNWRMSSMTASLGLSQLNKLDKIISKRQNNAKYISSKISKFTQLQIPKIPDGYEHIFQMYVIKLENKTLRDNLHNFLLKKRIFCKVYFDPIHLTAFYKNRFGYVENSLPNTEAISKRVLTLPLYPNMENEEKEYLIDSISEFFENLKT